MKILAIVNDRETAVEIYRVIQPLAALNKRGHDCRVLSFTQAAERMGDKWHYWPDIILFNRLVSKDGWEKHFDFPLYVRALGKAVVVDYDDDYTNSHRVVHDGNMPDLSWFSAVTVSTPYLRRVMRERHKSVHLLPNCVFPEIFARGERRIENLTIGLTGTATHKEDWEIVEEPILRVLAEHPEVRLLLSGYYPPNLKNHPQTITSWKLFAPDSPDPGDEFYVAYDLYPHIMANTDILLTPVTPKDLFNYSKSNLKAIEGQASGCAVIATGDVPNYLDAVKHMSTGILVNHFDAEGWYRAIKTLVVDKDLRKRLAENGKRHCLKYFDINTQIVARESLYYELHERAVKEQPKMLAEARKKPPQKLSLQRQT